jgi:hypothetical protein
MNIVLRINELTTWSRVILGKLSELYQLKSVCSIASRIIGHEL